MNTVLLVVLTLAIIVIGGYVVYLIIDLRVTIKSLKAFMATTEETLKPTLEELQLTLKSTRKITDNVGIVTDDIKNLTGSVREIGDNVRLISTNVSKLASISATEAPALKAGIKAGVEYLVKNLFAGGKHIQ